MPNAMTEPLLAATAATFEDLGYMFVELCDAASSAAASSRAATDGIAIVDYVGPFSGRVVVHLRGGVLPAISANMLGLDGPPPDEVQRDALGELANVVCGNVLPLVAGMEPTFSLGSPQHVDTWDEAASGAGELLGAVALRVDDRGYADVAIFRR